MPQNRSDVRQRNLGDGDSGIYKYKKYLQSKKPAEEAEGRGAENGGGSAPPRQG
jgi:hypothetical protein